VGTSGVQSTDTAPATTDRVLEAYRQLFVATGVPPSMREVGRVVDVSVGTVWYHVRILVELGLLTKTKRGYVPTKGGEGT
jgi:DNA-binding Lrp family transcriptional regulator